MDGIHVKKTPAKITTPNDREIHTERIFDASRERVWRAMTESDLIARWWGCGNRMVIERNELRAGGHWRFVEHSDHGVHGFQAARGIRGRIRRTRIGKARGPGREEPASGMPPGPPRRSRHCIALITPASSPAPP
jgi:hypothetical protein